MRKLSVGRSLLYFLEEIEYTEAALSADPDAETLAPAFRDAIDDWESTFTRERAARRDVVRAEAVVAVRNERIDRLTIRFAAAIRAFAPAFMDKVFKVAPNAFVRSNLRKQCDHTKNVIVAELTQLETDHPLKPFTSDLDTLAGTTVAALNERSARKGAAQLVANDVLEWKESVNGLRTNTYAELLKVATEKGLPKSWVESFFRAADDASTSDTDTEASPAPAPAPTP